MKKSFIRVLACVLTLVMVCGLVGCGGSKSDSSAASGSGMTTKAALFASTSAKAWTF